MTFDLDGLANRVAHATLILHCLNSTPDGGTLYVLDDPDWLEGNRCGHRGKGLTFADVDCNRDKKFDPSDRTCSRFVPALTQPFAQLGPVRSGDSVSVDLTEVFKTRW